MKNAELKSREQDKNSATLKCAEQNKINNTEVLSRAMHFSAEKTNRKSFEVVAAKGLAPSELNSVKWLPADEEIIEELKK